MWPGFRRATARGGDLLPVYPAVPPIVATASAGRPRSDCAISFTSVGSSVTSPGAVESPSALSSHEASFQEASSHEASFHEASSHEASFHEASSHEASSQDASSQDAESHEASDLTAFSQLVASQTLPEPLLADVTNLLSPRL